MRVARLSLFALFAAGCTSGTSDSVPLIKGFDPGPAPKNGMQIVMPAVEGIAPGASEELCSTLAEPVKTKLDLREIEGLQGITGHHVALYWSSVPGEADAHLCSDADNVNFRFVAGVSSTVGGEAQGTVAPDGIAFEIPAGSYLGIQQHFLNETDNTVTSQSALNLYNEDAGTTFTPSHGLAFLNSTLNLAPGADTLNIHCTMQNDFQAWMQIPHMHTWGTSFYATLTHAGTPTMLQDLPTWNPDWQFSPNITSYPTSAPLQISTGDTVDVQCNWDNTTSSALTFGTEMCVLFAAYIDTADLGNIACDGGSWTTF
jgi:hypothetical protein